MKRIRTLTTSLAILAIAGTTIARAQERGKTEQTKKTAPVPAAEQQRRVTQETQRTAAYKTKLVQQVKVVQQQAAKIDPKKRAAQVQTQKDYAARLQEQQQHLPAQREPAKEPYVSTPVQYRYVVSGTARETNQYGVDVLRQAVNNGYQEGYRAGTADRQDHWKSSYQTSPAYEDANFGYTGMYIAQTDYNYYFRQGFRRGYQDGYAAHFQYGANSNGTPAILAAVLTGILALKSIN